MPSLPAAGAEELLANLVYDLIHDLRQPLGNIETSVYLLNLVTPSDDERIRAQLAAIGDQLNEACRLLAEASAAVHRMPNRPTRPDAQPADADESLDLTNPVTADVT